MAGDRVLLEVCIDSAPGYQAAMSGGADRVEACSALEVGGLTPTWGLLPTGARHRAPIMAMIRPRAGSFVWSFLEVGQMLAEVEAARACGCAGVVIGALRPDGRLDALTLGALIQAAKGMEVTLHRCFDLAPDPVEALEQAIALGIHRILTSGGAASALDGAGRLVALHAQAAGRIAVMPGGGITPENVGRLLAAAPFAEVHASCSEAVPQDPPAVAMGFAAPTRRETGAGLVRGLRDALAAT